MNTNYFSECGNAEAIKTLYRELAKQYHPDLHRGHEDDGPEWTRIMQDINTQYAYAVNAANRREKPNKTEQEYASMADVAECIRKAIEAIITLDKLDIEICGLWVWVGGDTKPVKDDLKAAGYKWAPKKEKWYFAGVPAGGRGRFSMDDIRSRYGSEHVKAQRNQRDDDNRKTYSQPAFIS
jgi:curved DNA-binding protein CbpA